MTVRTENPLDALSLEQVLKTVPSGLFLVDTEQRIVHWNAEAERITGYTASEAVGRHCSFLSGIPCGRSCGLYEPAIPKPIIGSRCSVVTKGGERIILLKNVDFLRSADGQVVGGIESFIDISRQTFLEDALRNQAADLEKTVRQRTGELQLERRQLRSLLDAMADFAYICSPGHQIVLMNRAMAEAFGDYRGRTCFESFFGRPSPCDECPMAEVLAGRTVRQERRLEPNGRDYEIIHTPLLAPDGTLHKLAVFRDITERKEVEEQLREANRDLDAFVYTVSHDLRTPLTPVIAYAEFLRDEYGDRLDTRALDALREIEKHGHKMLALMEDLLVLARVGHVEAPPEPVDPTLVLDEVLAGLRESIVREGVDVQVRLLPRIAVPETLLFEILSNLIGNALRYAGGQGASIEVWGESEGDRVRFHIRDHGPGIPCGERDRIFDPFFRGTTAGKSPGTGIGLAIVRKIARLHGGRVWIEDTPGGGCTFILEFPRP